MNQARFFLRRLAFTGPAVPLRDVAFVDGVNVIWGASNAGKSFILKALDYMSGGGTLLPEIDQIRGYDRCWLTMDLPKAGTVTLARSLVGGDYSVFLGAADPVDPGLEDRTIYSEHRAKGDSLSSLLLGEMGIFNKRIARTLNGDKNTFTYRHFSPYIYTDETSMMGEDSPIIVDKRSGDTFDRNVLKFILTGVDDSALKTVPKKTVQRAANSGKLELIDDMIATARAELERKFPSHVNLDEEEDELLGLMADLYEDVAAWQTHLDNLHKERRSKREALADAIERQTEVELSLGRFDLLGEVYDSDIERLASLEEGSAALLAGAQRPCPLCGASPEHQHSTHGLEEVAQARRAVEAELAKIRAERADLRKAVVSLRAEKDGLGSKLERLEGETKSLDAQIEEALPQEASARERYEALDQIRESIRRGLTLQTQIAELEQRRALIAAFKPQTVPRGSVVAGIDGITGHELATQVQKVLHAWQFPGLPIVSFDDATHDILLNGKGRRGNGKGVRALMNAAFKIGVLLYCREKQLPHPGILVLDSPLLSYRDSLTSRHGALSADEEEVQESGLKVEFYRFLMEHRNLAQFIIIENDPPPADFGDGASITVFTGPLGTGARKGLF
ncbi:hypothetical protein DevBK_07325 [Devosia sp. BK]|uniref:hypothetical protein n=1 Tax=Devosia sp. BK TaxID=2871706 RepID=UPI00293A48DA|nr:hypothetical protein [Devosia sp. BK]MDV3251134.1 hypothetical protein [Devosia sp. BK]